MRELLAILGSIAFIAAIEGARQLVRWSSEKKSEELRRRLRALGQDGLGEGASLLRQGRLAKSAALDGLLRSFPIALRVERLLSQADSRFTVAQFLGWSALVALGGFTAGGVLRASILVALLLAVLGGAVPYLLAAAARSRRSNRVSEQLPEALDMMSRSLRAGHALTSSFEVVAGEMPEPIAVEFGRAFEAQRLGMTVEHAIQEMTERVPGNRDLKIFAVSAIIQRETGGNMAEILGNIAETIRARYRFYGKLRALTAEGRASGFVLGALPIAMVLLLQVVNPKYLVPLFTERGGHLILAFAIGIWAVGLVWLFRLTKVDI